MHVETVSFPVGSFGSVRLFRVDSTLSLGRGTPGCQTATGFTVCMIQRRFSTRNAFFGHLAEDTQQVAAHELGDSLLRIAAAAHGVDDLLSVANVPHPFRQSGTAIEVGA